MSANRPETFHLHFLTSIDEVDAEQWDALAGSAYPFMKHAFFQALEHSRSTTALTGWQPFHVVIKKSAAANSDDIDDNQNDGCHHATFFKGQFQW